MGIGPVLHHTFRLNQRDREVSEDRALEISTSPSLAIVRPSQEQVRNFGSTRPLGAWPLYTF